MESILWFPFTFLFRKWFQYLFVPFVQMTQVVQGICRGNKHHDHSEKKKRFDFFDLYKTNDIRKIGLMANEEEWDFELPSHVSDLHYLT